MKIRMVPTKPFDGQKPGTSGLRAKTKVFMQPRFLENFIQSIFDTIEIEGKTITIGGDGRHFNRRATQIILKMAAANGAAGAIVGQDGILSTPAASAIIRKRRTDGGIILSASHNPGGEDGDFGVKYNNAAGGPAPEAVTLEIYRNSQKIRQYRIGEAPDIDLAKPGKYSMGAMTIEIIDPVTVYRDLMKTLFDFPAIGKLFESDFTMRFDAMHAVTGPYARQIFEDDLGAPSGTVVNSVPLPDFGGHHPDPNPVHANHLMSLMFSKEAPDFGAASDGDGDRNMILGRKCYVTPSDSLAVLAANAHLAPGYSRGLTGIARSMPTSRASDRVATKLAIPLFETPTGWKYFGNLLDAGLVTICGEESAGTGSSHVHEKDGLWAVLLWLNIIAERRQSMAEIMRLHWEEFGRDYYSRHDYEAVDQIAADGLMRNLADRLYSMRGSSIQGLEITGADDFSYQDPVDGTFAEHQGIRIIFGENARIVFRLSGTGTVGATLRVYMELYEPKPEKHDLEPRKALERIRRAANDIAGIRERLGRDGPDVVT